eukprot:m.211199 g.211199  ORF g.211199 m.211199 type:complete len:1566 (-) comp17147_c0_seq4:48-4745(-)
MQMHLVLITVALLPLAFGKNSVITELQPTWHSTPLLLEASELLADVDNAQFWKLVTATINVHQLSNDKEVYERVLEEAQRLLDPLAMDVFKLNLAARSASPAVEMFFQTSDEAIRAHPDVATCNSFVVVGEQARCGKTQWQDLLSSAETQGLLDVDHVYPGASSSAPAVVLYATIGSVAFQQWHNILVPLHDSGKLQYIVRHYVKDRASLGPLLLSGWGVELSIKKTEYIATDDAQVEADNSSVSELTAAEDDIAGFAFDVLREQHPDLQDNLAKLQRQLVDTPTEVHTLKAWELQDVDMAAAARVLSSPTPLKTLQTLSHNFPTLQHLLASSDIPDALRNEITRNQQSLQYMGFGAGSNLLTLNDVVIDSTAVDIYYLLKLLARQSDVMAKLQQAGVPASNVPVFQALSVSTKRAAQPRLDLKSSTLQYFNNLEKDSEYSRWPNTLMTLMQPSPRGTLHRISRNIYNAVLVGRPTEPSFQRRVLDMQELYAQLQPVRLGLLMVTPAGLAALDSREREFTSTGYVKTGHVDILKDVTDPQERADVLLMRAYGAVVAKGKTKAGIKWLVKLYKQADNGEVNEATIKRALVARLDEKAWAEVLEGGKTLDTIRARSDQHAHGLGLTQLTEPSFYINGMAYDLASGTPLSKHLLKAVEDTLPMLQRGVYYRQIADHNEVQDSLMKMFKPSKRVLPAVLATHSTFASCATPPADTDDLSALTDEQVFGLVDQNLHYLAKPNSAKSVKSVTHWIVGDLNQASTQRTAFEALRRMLATQRDRIALVHSGTNPDPAINVATFLQAVLDTYNPDLAGAMVGAALATALNKGSSLELKHLLEHVKAADRAALKKTMAAASVATAIAQQAEAARRLLDSAPKAHVLVSNGRVYGPISNGASVTMADFVLVEGHLNDAGAAKTIASELKAVMLKDHKGDALLRARNTLARDLATVLAQSAEKDTASSRPAQRFDRKNFANLVTKHSGRVIKPRVKHADQPVHRVFALIDPASAAAQRIAPLLLMLHESTAVEITLLLNPVAKVSEVPLKRFYRMVLPTLDFDTQGALMPGPRAVFRQLPPASLLTLGMEVPTSWMVQSETSAHDLDNINLQGVAGDVYSLFRLSYLTVEGACNDAATRAPTAGLQLQLGTPLSGPLYDTLVMANLGYFQLKSQPGAWHLSMRPGRSTDIFDIHSVQGADSHSDLQQPLVLVRDFTGIYLTLKVARKPGMEKTRLLEAMPSGGAKDSTEKSEGIWDSISTFMGGNAKVPVGKNGKREGETINIFSIASGHLYERFLKIMMLSVLKNTNHPVKFWFLDSCMSPQMKAFLPHMAKEYGFEFQLVSYNWPHWLNKPAEKMRLIWAYKILFLDVLFPLDVKKIIFVDADQVVRADMNELVELDLKGAPYAYTPFCDSRDGMDGFRFWKQGYWKNHLAGKPYHISALYVVDLLRFRQYAAGDRLREQYQGLSQDPNSLSNLDQDLPNNMVHGVPIRSLPQEWLWCESWCSDASKVKAKTIDLCNNPKTKEPKLQAAVRIIPEWTELDEEARTLTEAVVARNYTMLEEPNDPGKAKTEEKDEL